MTLVPQCQPNVIRLNTPLIEYIYPHTYS